MALDISVQVLFAGKTRWVLTLALAFLATYAATAQARPALKTVSYRGVHVRVPARWPVLTLSRRTCVRFNRHAVYLGRPGASQSCPVNSVGRTEAVLLAPRGSSTGLSGPGVSTRTVRGVTITATWRANPGAARTLLGVRRLVTARTPIRAPAHAAVIRGARAGHAVSSTAPALPGAVFTGQGFDTCATPSPTTMAAWGQSSPYGAVGVYIGGANMACSQPNLTASWVAAESAAGWHIAPLYVGLQSPGNSCGCGAITPAQASSQGTAAALDAVAHAQQIGLGAGNPIYYDMEGYSRTTANSTTVLAFLQAWTQGLHSSGYLSGIYSSDASGIADLAAQYGTGYVEPDEIWIAAWNNQANTTDTTIATADWADHQRVHQYQGGSNATYGGVTVNVDNDYLDAATAAYGGGTVPAPVTTAPAASAAPSIQGAPVVGQTLTELHATWTGSPTGYGYQWYRCGPQGGTCSPIPGATAQTYTLTRADRLRTITVDETAANPVGAGAPSAATPTPPIYLKPSGFWSFTSTGTIDNSEYQLLYGSPGNDGLKDFAGMAASPDRLGYWMVTRHATVYAFGDARAHHGIRVAHPVKGIVPAGRAGYWIYTANGNVYAANGTPFYGSATRLGLSNFTGMAATPSGRGYWLVTSRGWVQTYGHAAIHPQIRKPASRVVGIVTARNGGYWLFTQDGHIFGTRGSGSYGSPAAHHVHDITGMLATPDRRGYWLITRTGTVFAFGDATKYPSPAPSSGAVLGLAG